MSVIQSKENIRGGKLSRYYGRLTGGDMSSHSGEMTRDEPLTLARLRALSPCEYESYCARGEEFRQRMTGAVLHALKPGDAWRTDCETRGEWGGVFPVHLRLTHRKCRHVTLDILSPGGESPFWHGLMWLNPDHTGLYFWNSEQLATDIIRELLQRIDEMVRAGYTAGQIAVVLRRGGIN
ncbi:conjugation system SOS inhibitor PsiB family protein [Pantoea agglomerans]|uniref:conjugation system SOS inhibitor PsiB family protein n=1 Tax=Enterobacter agglomerans TaxID=549 RepID=UPI00068B3507|nr:conjugation system SOS inhibitor PsiB family protein [Pantoea agglomerans]